MKHFGSFLMILALAACSSKTRIAANPEEVAKGLAEKAGGGAEGDSHPAGFVLDGKVSLYSAQEAKNAGLDLENISFEPEKERDQQLKAGYRDSLRYRVLGSMEKSREESRGRRIDRIDGDTIQYSETRVLKSGDRTATYRTIGSCELVKRSKGYVCKGNNEFVEGDQDLFSQVDHQPCEFFADKDEEPIFTIVGARFETAESKMVFERTIIRRSIEQGTIACKGSKPVQGMREQITIDTDEFPDPIRPARNSRLPLAKVTSLRDSDANALLSARVEEVQ